MAQPQTQPSVTPDQVPIRSRGGRRVSRLWEALATLQEKEEAVAIAMDGCVALQKWSSTEVQGKKKKQHVNEVKI